jgi:hypothetical protein
LTSAVVIVIGVEQVQYSDHLTYKVISTGMACISSTWVPVSNEDQMAHLFRYGTHSGQQNPDIAKT